MKNKKTFLILVGVIVAILLGNALKFINISEGLSKLGLNFAITQTSTDDCKISTPGIYDMVANDNNNQINGYTYSKGLTFKNVSSDDINSYSSCHGDFTFNTAEGKDYSDEKEFKLSSGQYRVGININAGSYQVTNTSQDSQQLQINVYSKKEGTANYYIKPNETQTIKVPDKATIDVLVLAKHEKIIKGDIQFVKK